MRFTPYAVACILTFSSLALSAPLPSIPNDASSLETRDTKLGDKPDRRAHPYHYLLSYASKPRRNVGAELDVESRDLKVEELERRETLDRKRGKPRPSTNTPQPPQSSRSGYVEAQKTKALNLLVASAVDKIKGGKRDVDETIEARKAETQA